MRTTRRILCALLCTIVAHLALAYPAGASEPPITVDAIKTQFAEGTIFAGNSLYFVDFSTSEVFRVNNGVAERVWHDNTCGPTGLLDTPNGLLVACYGGNSIVTISLSGKTLGTITRDSNGTGFISPNDLAADARGGVYFTGSGSETESGKVYYLGLSGPPKEVAADIADSNGVALSLDGKTLYVAESRAHRLLAFTIAPDGTLSDRHVMIDLPNVLAAGRPLYTPDGVRVDKRGRIFVGLYDGGGFAVFDPAGTLLRQIDIPGTHHANLAISPDGRFVYGTTMNDVAGGYRGGLYRVPNPFPE